MIGPLSVEQGRSVGKLCLDIAAASERIEVAAVVSRNGRLIEAAAGHSGAVSRLSPRQFEMLFMQLSLNSSMQSKHDQVLGTQCYTAVCGDFAVELAFPSYGGLLLVAADAGTPASEAADAVLEVLREFEFGPMAGGDV